MVNPTLPASAGLLREPLTLTHVKPRLLGHWGSTPGLNFIYAHLNRAILAHGMQVLFVARPGHGGPAMVVSAYLEGSYSEVYPAARAESTRVQGRYLREVLLHWRWLDAAGGAR